MSQKTFVGGVGMVKFTKPGSHEPYEIMGSQAVAAALQDAGIELQDIQQAYASYSYGDSACGQKTLYELGFPGAKNIRPLYPFVGDRCGIAWDPVPDSPSQV